VTTTDTKTSAPPLVRVHPADNVVVAVHALEAGAEVEIEGVRLAPSRDIPPGHKVALQPIAKGSGVIKYGERIGSATAEVAPGEHVHSHNLATDLREGDDYAYDPSARGEPPTPIDDGRTFRGYVRPTGRVGTRNEIWIINTVGCVNTSAERIARNAERMLEGQPSIDGVHAFSHPYGCSQLGDDLQDTQRVLAGLIRHPNAGGVLVMGLGCENNQLDDLLAIAGDVDQSRLRFFSAQEVEDEIEAGEQAVAELAAVMASDRREPRPLHDLTIGVKCGGSDGFSGLTANPLVGALSDEVIRRGGTVLQTEIPEMFGAERGLMNRAADEATFERVVQLIEAFKRYFTEHDQPVYENPSPGNKEGGLTTLEEKSLGAVQKGGRSLVTGVAGYGEEAQGPGLLLINAPGNDGVSSTAMAVAGAGLLLFTTGRGTPLGFPVPTLKISSNSDLASRKPKWIDFDAGRLLSESADRETLAHELLNHVIAVASGDKQANNEINDYREIAIWKRGVTL